MLQRCGLLTFDNDYELEDQQNVVSFVYIRGMSQLLMKQIRFCYDAILGLIPSDDIAEMWLIQYFPEITASEIWVSSYIIDAQLFYSLTTKLKFHISLEVINYRYGIRSSRNFCFCKEWQP